MTKEELKNKCTERAKIFQQAMESCHSSNPIDCIEWFADRIADLEEKLANADYQLEGRDNEIRELKEQIEKMKCLNEEIIKALKESCEYEWLPAHNGKAKYLYLQTVIDIVNEKFEEIKEK